MAHQNPSDKNYKSTNFCQKTTIEESESVCYSMRAAYFLMLCFSFRMRRTLSSMRCSVISPTSTALITASKASVNT